MDRDNCADGSKKIPDDILIDKIVHFTASGNLFARNYLRLKTEFVCTRCLESKFVRESELTKLQALFKSTNNDSVSAV